MKKILKSLCLIDSVSGNEIKLINYIKNILTQNYNCKINKLGNLIIEHSNKYDFVKNKILLVTPIDEVGLIVKKIEKDGYIAFMSIGEVTSSSLIGCVVNVNGFFGVIGQKPIHLQTSDEKSNVLNIDKLFIDIGCEDEFEANKIAKPGDFCNFKFDFIDFGQNRINSKSINSKIGAAVLIKMLHENLNLNFYSAFLTKTQVASFSASTVAFEVEPAVSIILNSIDEALLNQEYYSTYKKPIDFVLHYKTYINQKIFDLALDTAKKLKLNFELYFNKNKNDGIANSIAQTKLGTDILEISILCRQPNSMCSSVNFNSLINTLTYLKELTKNLQGVNFE